MVPLSSKNCPGSGPSSGGHHSQNTYASSEIENKFKNADLKDDNKKQSVNLSQMCLVMSLMDSDLDQLLKHKIDFSE